MSNDSQRYTVIVQDNAKRMIYGHIRFVAKVSVLASRKLRCTLYEAIASLGNMPFRCPEYPMRNTSKIYHQLIVGRYKIIFSINANDMSVNVRYILDSRREYDL